MLDQFVATNTAIRTMLPDLIKGQDVIVKLSKQTEEANRLYVRDMSTAGFEARWLTDADIHHVYMYIQVKRELLQPDDLLPSLGPLDPTIFRTRLVTAREWQQIDAYHKKDSSNVNRMS